MSTLKAIVEKTLHTTFREGRGVVEERVDRENGADTTHNNQSRREGGKEEGEGRGMVRKG